MPHIYWLIYWRLLAVVLPIFGVTLLVRTRGVVFKKAHETMIVKPSTLFKSNNSELKFIPYRLLRYFNLRMYTCRKQMKQIQSETVDLSFASVAAVCSSIVCVIAFVVSRSVVKIVLIKTKLTCKATF